MRRLIGAALALAVLGLAPAVPAQQKIKEIKDTGLAAHIDEKFLVLDSQLKALSDRLAALEADLTKIKQNQTDAAGEMRNAQNVMKATDTSLSNLRLGSESGILGLKSDLATMRQEITTMGDLIRRSLAASQPISQAAAPAPAPAPTATAPAPQQTPREETGELEGYITQISDDLKEVKISLGSDKGIKEGQLMRVYQAADPKKDLGIIEVKRILDANTSMAAVISMKQGSTMAFSDIVRPIRP